MKSSILKGEIIQEVKGFIHHLMPHLVISQSSPHVVRSRDRVTH